MAQVGGVLSRAGHTEAGCDLSRMAGFEPAAAIVEIMNEDGSMARRPDLEVFAKEHDLKIGTIADMIHYRAMNEQTVVRQEEHDVDTEFGQFKLITYKDTLQEQIHLAFVLGDVSKADLPIVRVQAPDFLRDTLGLKKEGLQSWSVQKSLEKISEEGEGVLVVLGGTWSVKLETRLSEFFRNTPAATQSASGAYLTVGTGSQILRDLGVTKMRLLNAPMKFSALSGFDLEVVEFLPYEG
jgi:3,4-dihydroxy 2-butanone 4-phosphate synthase/GTP cyclohydrolase II